MIDTSEEVVFPNEDGEFLLSDGSWGNPGCDECGMTDAVIKIDGTYYCADPR